VDISDDYKRRGLQVSAIHNSPKATQDPAAIGAVNHHFATATV